MGNLKGLPGISAKEIEAVFIEKPSEIKKILESGKAATTADDNGAINIWRDDDGNIRCEAMRHMRSLENKTFSTVKEAKVWTKEWMDKIK